MSSFKDIKNKLLSKEENTIPQPKIIEEGDNTFELEEARYLLSLIAKSDFKGQDIQIVYNIALKLQTLLKNLKD
jgi:hypothetical protein